MVLLCAMAFIMYIDRTNLAVAAPVRVDWPHMLRRVWPATLTRFCHGWVLWFFLNTAI
jgi:hypothetical protein